MLSVVGIAARPSSSSITVGTVRVQALSPTLVRVEPRGPLGFEDRPTFGIVGRHVFPGVAIWKEQQPQPSKREVVTLRTDYWSVELGPAPTLPTCKAPSNGLDAAGPVRAASCPQGAKVEDQGACCAL